MNEKKYLDDNGLLYLWNKLKTTFVQTQSGKGLSSNDFTKTYKDNVDSNTSARHSHTNKTVLDGITSTKVTSWDGKQAKLISGTNLKSVNGVSLLGAGNIDINAVEELTSPVRIWGLADGIYKLPENCKVYYYGSTNTSTYKTIQSSSILLVETRATSDKVYFIFGNQSGNGYIYTGEIKSNIGGINEFNLGNHYVTLENMPIATANQAGVVKVGSGLAISNGVLNATGGGTADAVEWANVLNKPSFKTVATSGSYNDLTNKPTIIYKTSEFINDAGFLKTSEVQGIVNEAVGNINSFEYVVTSELPSVGEESTIYLVPNGTGSTSDFYDEYLYMRGSFELIGKTNVDLSGYLQNDDVVAITNAEIDTILGV